MKLHSFQYQPKTQKGASCPPIPRAKSTRSLCAELAARKDTPTVTPLAEPKTPEMTPFEFSQPCTPQPASSFDLPYNERPDIPSLPVTYYKEEVPTPPFSMDPFAKQALGTIYRCHMCGVRAGSYNCHFCCNGHVTCKRCTFNRPYCIPCVLEDCDRRYKAENCIDK